MYRATTKCLVVMGVSNIKKSWLFLALYDPVGIRVYEPWRLRESLKMSGQDIENDLIKDGVTLEVIFNLWFHPHKTERNHYSQLISVYSRLRNKNRATLINF